MRRNILIGLVGLVVLGGLVAVNLAMREDPEPMFHPVSSPVQPRANTRVVDVTATREQMREREEQAAPAAPVEEGEELPAALAACDHAFVPSTPGQWRRYRWAQTGEARAAELRIRARRTGELPSGERAVTWAIEVEAADDHSELARAEMSTRCVPGRDAEEPWFGIMERALDLQLADAPGRWRWPAELTEGLRFEGTASFDPRGSDTRPPAGANAADELLLQVTRRHVVEERETVEVPAGRFSAWRVRYEERHAFGEHGETGSGHLWVAPDVGLVKSRAENSEGVVQTIELTSFGGP